MGATLKSKWNTQREATTYIIGKSGTPVHMFLGLEEIIDLRDMLNNAIEAAGR